MQIFTESLADIYGINRRYLRNRSQTFAKAVTQAIAKVNYKNKKTTTINTKEIIQAATRAFIRKEWMETDEDPDLYGKRRGR